MGMQILMQVNGCWACQQVYATCSQCRPQKARGARAYMHACLCAPWVWQYALSYMHECAPSRCTGSRVPRSGRSACSTASTVFLRYCPDTCTGSVGGLPTATTSVVSPSTCSQSRACHTSDRCRMPYDVVYRGMSHSALAKKRCRHSSSPLAVVLCCLCRLMPGAAVRQTTCLLCKWAVCNTVVVVRFCLPWLQHRHIKGSHRKGVAQGWAGLKQAARGDV